MKQYIIITPGIMDIGGAQMYTRNKVVFLKSKDYIVNVFHSGTGNGSIMINDLSSYINNRDFHINYPAYLWGKQSREEVLKHIYDIITPNTKELIIESHSVACSTWGELIAEKTKAKHIVYLLSEYNSIRNVDMYRFFRFKLERRELAGITYKTIPILFRKYEILEENNSNYLSASCTNVVENIPYTLLSDIPEADFTIGSIGRINKLFVNDMLDDFIDFVKQYPEKKFTLIFIGGEPREANNKNVIIQKFKSINNVSLFFTGYIYPIPRELVIKPDVFISSAGSCYVSSKLGIPTISIDSSDHKPIGIIGETTNNILFRNKELQTSLQDLLNDILIKKVFKKNPKDGLTNKKLDLSEHLCFLQNIENSTTYYSFENIHFSFIDWIERLSLSLFGDNQLRWISMKLLPLWNRVKVL